MGSNAVAGVGTLFRRWNVTTGEWEAIAEINSITGPGKTRATINVTSLDSIDGYEEFITGFRNAGTVVLAMNFTRETYDLMNDDFEDDDLRNYEIILPDKENTCLEFEGLVTELPLAIPAGDKISADVTIQVSGKVVITSGSAASGSPGPS